MVTAVLFVQHASPSTITTFHDQISNELPKLLGPWSFELQIFLNNKYSKPPEIHPSQVPNRYLYSLTLSYLEDKRQTISIINNTKSIVTTIPNFGRVNRSMERDITDYEIEEEGILSRDGAANGADGENAQDDDADENDDDDDDDLVQGVLRKNQQGTIEEAQRNKKLLEHIRLGCCNNLCSDTTETFEFLLTSKLQSLWTLKQAIKGEGGFGYIIGVPLPINDVNDSSDTEIEKFKLRTSNCFLHGAFKGFLIEIEHMDEKEDQRERDEDRHKQLTDVEKKNRLILRFTKSIGKIKSLIETFNFPEGNLCFNVLSETKLDYLSDLCQQYCDALQF
ncbi:DEKNAAC104997 [Brettanomyces naardenensis]|uniref:Mediator of RNA polymerase II transcription subunit 20 n=1 Tax=Brettanomyces naardenensis TaxID=13370 RepID=A0A448YS23_BRENA|nr:DEKNAAC104997 [Brettanomyces naardenensis]